MNQPYGYVYRQEQGNSSVWGSVMLGGAIGAGTVAGMQYGGVPATRALRHLRHRALRNYQNIQREIDSLRASNQDVPASLSNRASRAERMYNYSGSVTRQTTRANNWLQRNAFGSGPRRAATYGYGILAGALIGSMTD